jgi:hypothetical protein
MAHKGVIAQVSVRPCRPRRLAESLNMRAAPLAFAVACLALLPLSTQARISGTEFQCSDSVACVETPRVAEANHDAAVWAKIREYLERGYALKGDVPQETRIQFALNQATEARTKGDNSSDPVLRDAEYYLHGLYAVSAHDYGHSVAVLAAPVYNAAKYVAAALRLDEEMRTDPTNPNSSPGGTYWAYRGLFDGSNIQGAKEVAPNSRIPSVGPPYAPRIPVHPTHAPADDHVLKLNKRIEDEQMRPKASRQSVEARVKGAIESRSAEARTEIVLSGQYVGALRRRDDAFIREVEAQLSQARQSRMEAPNSEQRPAFTGTMKAQP